MSTRSHEHARPAEIKLDSTICAQRLKMGYILLDPKLYAKVLRIWHQSLLNKQFNI